MSPPPRRVFIGTTEIGGYYLALARALRELGVPADQVDVSAHPFRYGRLADRPRPIALAESVGARREAQRRAGHHWRFRAWTLAFRLAMVGLMLWSLARYDTYVFGFGATFAGTRDLRLLRWFRKRVVMVYHGSDVRPPYMDGSDMDPRDGRGVADVIALTRRKVDRIRRAERHATAIVCHPLYSQFFRRRCVSYLALGVPMLSPGAVAPLPDRGSGGLRVLHAPSNPYVKGTALIRAGIDELKRDGHAIDYQEIVGRPNAEVLAAIDASDLIVDQVYSDLPYSIFGAEAASRARPVVVAGYGGEWLTRCLPAMPPVVWSAPETVTEAIRGLLDDPERRVTLGQSGRDFVSDWDPQSVARRLLRVVAGDVDPAWWFDPADYAYPFGCGLPRERTAQLVHGVVESAGDSALGVDHHPALKAALLAL